MPKPMTHFPTNVAFSVSATYLRAPRTFADPAKPKINEWLCTESALSKSWVWTEYKNERGTSSAWLDDMRLLDWEFMGEAT